MLMMIGKVEEPTMRIVEVYPQKGLLQFVVLWLAGGHSVDVERRSTKFVDQLERSYE
jgi:hypothetical protein